jgi:hypothetical protein
MVMVGGQGTVVSGVKGQITLNGNIYAVARTYTFSIENKLDEEPVAGSDIPIIITAAFHGEGDMTILYSTENSSAHEQFVSLVTPGSNGAIAPVNFVFTGTDSSGTTRTFTWTGTLWPQKAKITVNGPSVVIADLHFLFNSRPTLT